MRKVFATVALIAVLMAAVGVPVYAAAGSVTTTSVGTAKTFTKYTLAWTSDASGNVTANASTVRVGELFKAEIVPGSGGTQPTDLYDVTLLDSNSVDVLGGVANDQSNATGRVFQFDPGMYVDDTALTLTIANAGNAKTGTVILWVR